MPTGILIVDKPADWTSQDVAARLRGVFRERRVGHGGTLDPMATGVLPVFVGRATRAVSFFESADKAYDCALRPGLETDTQDITGRVVRTHPGPLPGPEALEALLPDFLGEQDQLPPMYSAIKIGGKKLYELARKGVEAQRTPRRIVIHALACTGRTPEGDLTLHVECSKGTYIRTLCADLGAALGCGGCMSALRRTRAGRFSLSDAHTMEEILAAAEAGEAESLLLPTDRLFDDRPAVTVPHSALGRIRNGNPLFGFCGPEGEVRVYGPEGEFLALAELRQGTLTTIKSFFEV